MTGDGYGKLLPLQRTCHMIMYKKTKILVLIGLSIIAGITVSAQNITSKDKTREAEKIKDAARYAWNGYTHYAWGYDALRPITKQGQNWYDVSFQMNSV